jgi:hypothetical protein
MADKLTWFKFQVMDWTSGRIQKRSKEAQADFVWLCCKYWNEGCEMTLEDATLETCEETIQELVKFKIVKLAGDKIAISFLDDQYFEALKITKKASEAGKVSAENRRNKAATNAEQVLNDRSTDVQRPFNDRSTDVEQNRIEENRIEQKRKEEKKNNTDFMFDLQRDEIWIEQTCMALQTDKTTIKIKLPEAAALFDSRGEDHANRRLFQSHFVNWLREDLKKPKPAKAKQTQPTELLNLIDQQLNNASNDNGHLHIG